MIKLYTVVVYDVWICMKGDNSGPKYIKGDNYFRTGVGGVFLVIRLTVLFFFVFINKFINKERKCILRLCSFSTSE